MRAAALLLAIIALGGCAPMMARTPPGAAAGVTVNGHVSRRFVEIVGRRAQHAPPYLGVPETNYFVLRSWLDRTTGAAYHQLYVSDSYAGDRRGWEAASADGAALRVIPVSHHLIACAPGCSWTEDFAADIPDAVLTAHRDGLAITFAAHSGATMRVEVSGVQVQAQLAAIAVERRRLVTSRGSPGSRPSARTAPPRSARTARSRRMPGYGAG